MKKDICKTEHNEGWKSISAGGAIYGSGNSVLFNTGDWRVDEPQWDAQKCKQCLLCNVVCPDSSIPIKNGKRENFDYEHCKGCGICIKACHFDAISFGTKKEE